MTEALFSITPAGKLISVRYYTITRETLDRKIITDELIDEVLRRSSSAQKIPEGGPGDRIPKGDSIIHRISSLNISRTRHSDDTECFAEPQHSDAIFSFEDLQVEIFERKFDHKIEFFVSRDIPKSQYF